MNTDSHAELVRLLKEGDENEVPFVRTKELLLQKGYTNEQITAALYVAPYDGKKARRTNNTAAHAAFASNPDLAVEIGQSMLIDAEARQKAEAAAAAAAGRYAPGMRARMHYESIFFEEIGVPYFLLLFFVIGISLAVLFLRLPAVIEDILYVCVGGLVLWRVVVYFMPSKRKTNTSHNIATHYL